MAASSPGIVVYPAWLLSASFARWRMAKLARRRGNRAADRADQTSRRVDWGEASYIQV